ncbi:MAG: hypothetical protein EOM63_05780, partial [Clostridia bacterium]|nr:hypothetical protein [Clostridia bacterium]
MCLEYYPAAYLSRGFVKKCTLARAAQNEYNKKQQSNWRGGQTMEANIAILAQELQVRPEHAEAVVRLLDEGNTVPFIARYRKEQHGTMDDQTIRALADRLTYLRGLDARRAEVKAQIETQGKLTDELTAAIDRAATLAEVDDLYRPYRPKRRTRASMARERGLAPLADMLWTGRSPSNDPLVLAADFMAPDKDVPDAASALAGARDILAETLSDDAALRKTLRAHVQRTGVLRTTGATEEDTVYRLYYDFKAPLGRVQSHQILAIDRGEREGALKVAVVCDDAGAQVAILRAVLHPRNPFGEVIREVARDAWDRLIFPSLEREVRGVVSGLPVLTPIARRNYRLTSLPNAQWGYTAGERSEVFSVATKSDGVSGAAFSLGNATRGGVTMDGFNCHPPYRDGLAGGFVWYQVYLDLPQVKPISLHFATAIRDHNPPREHHGWAHMFLMEELPERREDDAYLEYLEQNGYGHIRCQHGVRPFFYHTPQPARVPEEHHGSAWVAHQTIELLREERDVPFCIMASWVGPHPPYYVPESYLEEYRDAALPPPCPLPSGGERQFAPSPENPEPGSLRAQRLREAYFAACTLIDTHIGRILDALEETGQAENTLVFFTSDHGEMLGDRQGYQKHFPYEGSAHIPY